MHWQDNQKDKGGREMKITCYDCESFADCLYQEFDPEWSCDDAGKCEDFEAKEKESQK